MVSYAIVYRRGLESTCAAQAAGVAGAIVPDLPVEEAGPLADVCRREDFSLIQLIAPTTPRERALRIAERTSGFIYYVSVTGITGERSELPREIGRQRGLAARADAAADLHRLRHQPAGARADAGSGGRRPDRRLGDRSPPGRSRPTSRARRCWPRSRNSWANCWRRCRLCFRITKSPLAAGFIPGGWVAISSGVLRQRPATAGI